MTEITKTMKLRLYADETADKAFREMTAKYADACTRISKYIFDNGFILNFMTLQKQLYSEIRNGFDLKAQMTISAFKTVTARYKTLKEQLEAKPYKCVVDKKAYYFRRDLSWLQKPIVFGRPQADLVRNRDYSFVHDKKSNTEMLSINTLGKRVKVGFVVPDCFREYFDSSEWKFGTAKLVSLKGIWYLHIPVTKETADVFDASKPKHVVGIDRGLRFLATAYDEKGDVTFISGKDVLKRRDKFKQIRAELQSKGTKSAKRVLKRLSGRENRWMADVNHCLSKTLVDKYGSETLFVLEDLSGVSFSEENLSTRNADDRSELRSWTFYQLEQDLIYKAHESGSKVLKVPADYTSQRCPKCGRILKENRHHETHEYICDCCGYRSNDDRVGAMNIQQLGAMYVSGDMHPRFGARKTEKSE